MRHVDCPGVLSFWRHVQYLIFENSVPLCPHFLHGDPKLLKDVVGLNPDVNRQEFFYKMTRTGQSLFQVWKENKK